MRTLGVVLLVCTLLLTACGGNSANQRADRPTSSGNVADPASSDESSRVSQDMEVLSELEAEEIIAPDDIQVDKNLLNVEVNLPASMFEGSTAEEIKAEAALNGIDNVTVNSDGSVTYVISKAKHRELLEENRKTIIATIEDIITSGNFPSIKDVKYNDAFTEFTLVVDRAAFENSFDSFAVLGLYISASFYQIFDGRKQDDIDVTIHYEDASSGVVFRMEEFP